VHTRVRARASCPVSTIVVTDWSRLVTTSPVDECRDRGRRFRLPTRKDVPVDLQGERHVTVAETLRDEPRIEVCGEQVRSVPVRRS
jgi:hypothetical protein